MIQTSYFIFFDPPIVHKVVTIDKISHSIPRIFAMKPLRLDQPAHVRIAIGCFLVFAFCSNSSATPSDFEDIVQPYLKQYCLECHGEKAKAGYRVDQLGSDFNVVHVADQWKEVIDRINAGDMPPKEKPRPEIEQSNAVVAWVQQQLREVDLRARNAGGRIPMRRLNRDEYANSIRDLLHIDENLVRPLLEEMPADGTAEGFDRLAAGLFFDQTQLERSLDAAAKIAAIAVVTTPPKTNRLLNKLEFVHRRPPADEVEVFPAFQHTIPRGAKSMFVHPGVVEYIQGGPTYRRELAEWGAIEHFAISKVVTQDGYYRIRINARVDQRARKEPNRFLLQYAMDSPIQMVQEIPYNDSGVTETMMFLRGPVNGEVKGPQVFRLLWNHNVDAVIREPQYTALVSQWTKLRGEMSDAVTRRATEAELLELKKQRDALEAQLNAWSSPANIYNPAMEIEKLPRLLLESIEIEGPIQKTWPPESHQTLFFEGDLRDDEAYIREMFARLLPQAYRRPATNEEVDAVVAIVQEARTASNKSLPEAVRVGLQWLLCSPGFVFLHEPTKESHARFLNDFEFASRLSYFLWSSMPDDELFSLAKAGTLRKIEVVQSQVQRMLADSKSSQLVRNFGGQWLSVRDYGSVQPAAEYRDYDKPLEQSAKQEPLAFFAEVLHENLPITSFLDSDFLVINERLAKHYGIEGVEGDEFRRVAIKPEHHRGGVLGMAGLMTLLADGTRTLPIRRGSWVLRELFNDPPNAPPPNAGEIQPNTSGKKLTVRERLDMHRSDDVCASCHTKLDPFGLALENYDAIGRWRERFNGEGFRGSNGPILDVSGAFPDGTQFTTLAEYKAGLLSQKDRFARAFSFKLLTYALGRPVGYTDHELLDRLVETLQQNEYRIQPLLQTIVMSETFQTK
jgi:mono/diheme cytochrome c family protein